MSKSSRMKPVLVMSKIAHLAQVLGTENIQILPRCWERQIDGRWWIAVNGRSRPIKCSKGMMVQPFECYIEYNGFPAGILNCFEGIIAAGKLANEKTFIKAIDKAIRLVNGNKS